MDLVYDNEEEDKQWKDYLKREAKVELANNLKTNTNIRDRTLISFGSLQSSYPSIIEETHEGRSTW